MERGTKGKGKRQNKIFFLFQLSGWLNVVFLLVVAGALFVFPAQAMTYTQPALPVQQSGLPVLGGMIWAITAVAGAVSCATAGVGFEC